MNSWLSRWLSIFVPIHTSNWFFSETVVSKILHCNGRLETKKVTDLDFLEKKSCWSSNEQKRFKMGKKGVFLSFHKTSTLLLA